MQAPRALSVLPPGTRIADRYTVLRTIGSGGMGTVYEIESTNLGNRLALKVLSPKFAVHRSVVARFHQEARFQATITHPGITRVFELVQEEDLLGIVMEYVQAPTLADVMDDGPMDPAVVRGVVRELLSTLGACHDQGIAHRDLKPENIFVFSDGHGGVRCKLADFGVAKLLTPSEDDAALTRGHSFVGTPMYASPEQVERSASIDGRSDLYSLGVVAWEMLSGEEPYGWVGDAESIQVAVVTDDLPALPSAVPEDLRNFVVELTRKERDERPHNAREAQTLLRHLPASPPAPVKLDQAVAAQSDPLLAALPSAGIKKAEPTFEFAIEKKAPVLPAVEAVSLPEQPPPLPAPDPVDLEAQRLASLRTAGVMSRLAARLLDEMLLQLMILSCIGIAVYPFVAPLRGAFTGRSLGSRILELQVVAARTGHPASLGRMLLRNGVDLLTWQLGVVAVVWPVGWLWFVPLFGVIWLLLWGTVELLFAMIHPKGRRLADFIAGTRVVMRP